MIKKITFKLNQIKTNWNGIKIKVLLDFEFIVVIVVVMVITQLGAIYVIILRDFPPEGRRVDDFHNYIPCW